ncbi:hypothetical protein Tco_1121383 [Tanacetum coccineum]|uniref:Uncharacterized protein n=1 Tax=Tanacetum coccineum TaxID=301880 RepID=A0ABQ5J0H2_9ASTR
MGKELFDPNSEICGDNGGRGSSMVGRGGGWLAKRSIVSNKGCGGGGLAVRGGRSSSESQKGFCLEVNFYGLAAENRMEPAFDKEGNRLFVVNNKQWSSNEVKAMQRCV